MEIKPREVGREARAAGSVALAVRRTPGCGKATPGAKAPAYEDWGEKPAPQAAGRGLRFTGRLESGSVRGNRIRRFRTQTAWVLRPPFTGVACYTSTVAAPQGLSPILLPGALALGGGKGPLPQLGNAANSAGFTPGAKAPAYEDWGEKPAPQAAGQRTSSRIVESERSQFPGSKV